MTTVTVVVPGVDDEGSTGFESLLDGANGVLHEMVDHGVLTSEERGRMVVPTHPRRRKDLLEPFEKGRYSKQLTVEDSAMSQVADSAWDLYERDGDRDALINKRVPFFRSVFVPSLACALDYTRSQEGKRFDIFGDELERRLKRRLANHLAPMNSFVQAILLVKE